MDIETILNAYIKVSAYTYDSNPDQKRRLRQYRAFRARILRMFEERENSANWEIEKLWKIIKEQEQKIIQATLAYNTIATLLSVEDALKGLEDD